MDFSSALNELSVPLKEFVYEKKIYTYNSISSSYKFNVVFLVKQLN